MNKEDGIEGVRNRDAAEVLIHAPLGTDAQAIRGLLDDASVPARVCGTVGDLKAGLSDVPCKALCIVLSHEGSGPDTGKVLREMLDREPRWSSPPVVVLTDRIDAVIPVQEMLAETRDAPPPLLLKRPVLPGHFVSAVEIQIAARRRQFEVGSLMATLREAERRQRFLLDELRHRTRNLLAVINSMFSMTARTTEDKEVLIRDFQQRLSSIAAAQTALSSEVTSGLPLTSVIATHVHPYALSAQQVVADGPQVMLNHKAAFELAMVMHELATNAAKYGALSVETGTVTVTWTFDDRSRLCLTWQERGGPPTSPPSHSGLGTRVIHAQSLAAEEGADVDFGADGLTWRLKIGPEQFLRPVP